MTLIPDNPYPYPYLVESILRVRRIHLFGGSSQSGKTTLVLQQFVGRWQQGLPVFGYASYPTPNAICFVACDRPLAYVHDILTRTQIAAPCDLPAFSLIDTPLSGPDPSKPLGSTENRRYELFEQVLAKALHMVPTLKLLIIDGFLRLCPGKINEDRDMTDFLCYVLKRIQEEDITLIGTVRATKVKNGENFRNPRECVTGSGAVGTTCDLIGIMERDKPRQDSNLKRTLHLSCPGTVQKTLHLAPDSKGLFYPCDADISRIDELTTLIALNPLGTELTLAALNKMAAVCGKTPPSESTIKRDVKILLDMGILVKAKFGRYVVAVQQQ